MSESPNREEAIFDDAVKLSADQRAGYLHEACGDDEPLRRRVEALIVAHIRAGEFLAQPVASAPKPTMVLSLAPAEKVDDKIGRYKILQLIGEGGCGAVYMAEQEEPVRRRVALKVIKLGMDTKSVIARFEAERQALALMDHPNIAKVLDAGATDSGRPFFVMELVRGIKITDYCDQNKLATEERLALFIQVCNAIQHAHQKGIIHRDIKPSNILVTLHDGKPVPKVIDFGIAKATQGRLTDQTLFTAFEQFIGTPAYMSPEQAEMSGLDIDTRSDIYALGVLLYELLTGWTPFDPKELLQSGLDELRRTIREKEPARPSTRLSTMLDADLTAVAHRRQSEAPKLIHLLSGDLDWIVMKALEKDRTRRYETANGLAMDIQRYLGDEAVLARPPSTLYRFKKLARRNKTIFAAAGVGLTAMIIGLMVSLCLYVQEKAALKRAMAAEQNEKQLRQQAEYHVELNRKVAQAGLLLMREKYAESEQIIANVPPVASLVPFYNVFGSVHARHGEWTVALTNWTQVVAYAPADHLGYIYLAPLLLQLDNVDGYQRCRTQMLQRFADASDPRIAERVVKAALILPPAAGDFPVITNLAAVAGTGDRKESDFGYNLVAQGFTEYRLGHYAQAVDRLQQVKAYDPNSHCLAEAWLLCAMAYYQLGQPDQCRDVFARANDIIVHNLPKAGHLDDEWNEWIIIHLLLREAVALIPDSVRPAVIDASVKPAWQEALAKANVKFDAELQDDGTWSVDIENQPFADLSIFGGVLVSRLSLSDTSVTDLRPLHGLPLKRLRLGNDRVTDLSPLAGLPLTYLQLSGTPVADISPLRGMPLRDLRMTGCPNLTRVDALADMTTLQDLILPPHAVDYDFLRGFANLARLSFKYNAAAGGAAQTAAEFWAQHDTQKAPAQP